MKILRSENQNFFKDLKFFLQKRLQQNIKDIDESVKKRNRGDFVLWKFEAKAGSDPAWPSPWGQGRPGWHIEDTAITEKRFGVQYELHGGVFTRV